MTESVENNKLSYVLRSQLAEIQGSDLTIGIQTRVGTQVRLSDPEVEKKMTRKLEFSMKI